MKARWIVAVLGLLALTGCGLATLPSAHQIERMVLLETLGVDLSGVDGVEVTAVSPRRSTAGQSSGHEPVIVSARADTVTAAREEMQSQGSDFLFFGDVEQILIGEKQALRGIDDLLHYVAQDPELRLESKLWVVQGSASQALTQVEDATNRLKAMASNAQGFGLPISRTLREVLVEHENNGCTVLPGVVVGETSGEVPALEEAGYALFQSGALMGWAEGDAVRGITMLLGGGESDVVELTTPDCSKTALTIEDIGIKIEPQNGGATLYIQCTIKTKLSEYRGVESSDDDTLIWLGEKLSEQTKKELEAAIDLCRQLQGDYLNLVGRGKVRAPWASDALDMVAFEDLDIEVAVKAEVERE